MCCWNRLDLAFFSKWRLDLKYNMWNERMYRNHLCTEIIIRHDYKHMPSTSESSRAPTSTEWSEVQKRAVGSETVVDSGILNWFWNLYFSSEPPSISCSHKPSSAYCQLPIWSMHLLQLSVSSCCLLVDFSISHVKYFKNSPWGPRRSKGCGIQSNHLFVPLINP